MFDKNKFLSTTPQTTIGALSKSTGCNIETIRYYERIKLFPEPARTEGGHRMYGAGHVKLLGFIRRARELGFTLEEVRALMRLAEERDQPCAEVRKVAAGHLNDVRVKTASLTAMERVLKDMVSRCEEGVPPDCPLIEALFDERHEFMAKNTS